MDKNMILEEIRQMNITADENTAKHINDFLSNISSTNRQIFVRRYYYMNSINDIASAYDKSENYVNSSLVRTRGELEAYINCNMLQNANSNLDMLTDISPLIDNEYTTEAFIDTLSSDETKEVAPKKKTKPNFKLIGIVSAIVVVIMCIALLVNGLMPRNGYKSFDELSKATFDFEYINDATKESISNKNSKEDSLDIEQPGSSLIVFNDEVYVFTDSYCQKSDISRAIEDHSENPTGANGEAVSDNPLVQDLLDRIDGSNYSEMNVYEITNTKPSAIIAVTFDEELTENKENQIYYVFKKLGYTPSNLGQLLSNIGFGNNTSYVETYYYHNYDSKNKSQVLWFNDSNTDKYVQDIILKNKNIDFLSKGIQIEYSYYNICIKYEYFNNLQDGYINFYIAEDGQLLIDLFDHNLICDIGEENVLKFISDITSKCQGYEIDEYPIPPYSDVD